MGIFRKAPGSVGADHDRPATTTHPLNMSEESWRDEQHVRACDLVTYYTSTETDSPTLGQLDATVVAWAADTSGDRPEVGDIDNALGIALGEILADHTDLTWVIADGPDGPDLALHSASDEVVVFPRAVVAEHLDAGTAEPFFARVHADLATEVRRVQHH